MKKALKKLAKAILYVLVIAIPTLIAIKCGNKNQAKRIEETTVKNSENLVKSRRIDKVSSTKNEKKLAWMEGIYNK